MSEPKTSSTGDKARAASLIIMCGVLYSRLVFFLTTVILARILAPEDFGLIALGTSLMALLTSATDLSLGSALVQQKSVDDSDLNTVFTLSVARGTLLALILMASGYIMASIYNDDRLVSVCFGLAARPFISGLASPRYILFYKELDFRIITFQEGINFTVQLLVSALVAYLTGSYWALVLGAVAASLAGTIMTYLSAPYIPRYSITSAPRMLNFSIWLTFNQIVSAIEYRFDNFLAGAWLGISTFGAYNTGNNIAGMITYSAITPLTRVLFPSFTKFAGDAPRLIAAFQKSQSALLAVGLAVGVGQALVADAFVFLTLGPGWEAAALVIKLIAPVLGFQIIFGPVDALASALGNTRGIFNRATVLLLVRVPIVFVGMYCFGLTGLLVSRLIFGALVVSTTNLLFVKSLINISPYEQLIVTWRSWVSALIMSFFLLSLNEYLGPPTDNRQALVSLIISVSVGALSYCSTHYILWRVSGKTSIGIEYEIASMLSKSLNVLKKKLSSR